jgi:hypothetical protein
MYTRELGVQHPEYAFNKKIWGIVAGIYIRRETIIYDGKRHENWPKYSWFILVGGDFL